MELRTSLRSIMAIAMVVVVLGPITIAHSAPAEITEASLKASMITAAQASAATGLKITKRSILQCSSAAGIQCYVAWGQTITNGKPIAGSVSVTGFSAPSEATMVLESNRRTTYTMNDVPGIKMNKGGKTFAYYFPKGPKIDAGTVSVQKTYGPFLVESGCEYGPNNNLKFGYKCALSLVNRQAKLLKSAGLL